MSDTKRRLAAVMFTDIVGYSRLMNSDESKAMKLLDEHDKIAEDCFKDYNGRLIKKIGDADFVEFSSALDAVKCAIKIQETLGQRNSSCENSFDEIHVRIGIHVGDIIEKGDDIFGDGVNIASRIVSVADGGEICISKEANASIQGQKEILSASIGSHNLKNIVESWDLYRIFVDKDDYSSWAEDNYSKQVSLREQASALKRYLYAFIILFVLIINIPIVRYSYSEWSNKSSIKELSQDLELILSSNRMLGELIFLKTKEKDIYLSISQDFLFPAGKSILRTEYDKDSTEIVKKEINNALIPIIELMNKFDGNIEISSNSDSDQPPKQWRKRIPSNAHLSGARSASMLKYFIKSGLKVNDIKVKNLLWGSYKPYQYIDSETIPSEQEILDANSDYKKKAMNRRVDIHFYYD